MLQDVDLKDFQKLCFEEYSLEITKQEASDFGNALINLLIDITSNNTRNVS